VPEELPTKVPVSKRVGAAKAAPVPPIASDLLNRHAHAVDASPEGNVGYHLIIGFAGYGSNEVT